MVSSTMIDAAPPAPARPARSIPTVRVFRLRRGEVLADARQRRPELVTLDTQDLLRIITRCGTSLDRGEVRALQEAIPSIPPSGAADVFLAPGGRVLIAARESA